MKFSFFIAVLCVARAVHGQIIGRISGDERRLDSKCSAYPACAALPGDCCPSIDNVFLDCCSGIMSIPTMTPSASASFLQAEEDAEPTGYPTLAPSFSVGPADGPASFLQAEEDNEPTGYPTLAPSFSPGPAEGPSEAPSDVPSTSPSLSRAEGDAEPTGYPTLAPSFSPGPAGGPSEAPKDFQFPSPSLVRAEADAEPTGYPSLAPSFSPGPSGGPSEAPSNVPSEEPAGVPFNVLAEEPKQTRAPSGLPGPEDAKCSANPACSALSGDCCPTIDNVFLDCCSGITGIATFSP